MRKIYEDTGDLLELFSVHTRDKVYKPTFNTQSTPYKIDIFVHGANCFSLMGAGIAGQVATKYPSLLKADREFKFLPIDRLGKFSTNGKGMYNLYTQYQPGANAEYEAVRQSFRALNKKYQRNIFSGKRKTIGIPQIGCGIGGLEWPVVKEIILKEVTNMDIVFVTYSKV